MADTGSDTMTLLEDRRRGVYGNCQWATSTVHYLLHRSGRYFVVTWSFSGVFSGRHWIIPLLTLG